MTPLELATPVTPSAVYYSIEIGRTDAVHANLRISGRFLVPVYYYYSGWVAPSSSITPAAGPSAKG